MIYLKSLLCLCLLLAFPLTANAAVRYINCQAATNGAGTATAPHNTLSALTSYSANDTIKFKGGSTCWGALPAGNMASGVTFTDYSTTTTKPKLSGRVQLTGWTQVGGTSIWSKSNNKPLYFDGRPAPQMTNQGIATTNRNYSVPWEEYNSTTGLGLSDGEYYINSGTTYIRSVVDGTPAEPGARWLIEAQSTTTGFSLADSANNFSDITFSNLIFELYTTAISLADPQATGMTLSNVTFQKNGNVVLYSSTATVTNCKWTNFVDGTGYTYGLLLVAGTYTVSGCEFSNMNSLTYGALVINSSATYTIDGCTFAGVNPSAIHVQSGASASVGTVKNSIFAGVPASAAKHPIDTSLFTAWTGAGALTVSHSLFSGGWGNYGMWTTTANKAVTNGGDNRIGSPDFVATQPIYVVMTSDEWESGAEYSGLHQGWIDLIKSYNNPNWTGMTTAIHWTQGNINTSGTLVAPAYDSTDYSNLAAYKAAGGEIATHTRWHNNISVDTSATIITTFSDVTIEVTATRFKIMRSGVVDTVGIPLQPADGFHIASGDAHQHLTQIVADVNAATGTDYIMTGGAGVYSTVRSYWLEEGTTAIPVSTLTTIYLSISKYHADEIVGSISDLESGVSGLTVKTMLIPNGPWRDDFYTAPWLKSYGLVGARTIEQPTNSGGMLRWDTPTRVHPFEHTATQEIGSYNISGLVASYTARTTSGWSGLVTDNGAASGVNDLTKVGTVNSVTTPTAARHSGKNCIQFDGTTGYMYRSSLTNMVYTDSVGNGDWQWGAYVYPSAITGSNRTIVWQQAGTGSPTDYHWLYVDTSGQVHYELYTTAGGGTPVIHLTSGATTLALNTPYAISVRQLNGTIELWLSANQKWASTRVDYAVTATTPVACTGQFQVGASNVGGTKANFWNGYMDTVFIAAKPRELALGLVEVSGIMGNPIMYYGHITMPHDLLKTLLETWATHRGGKFYVKSFYEYITETKALGGDSTSGLTYSYSTGTTNDYRPIKGGNADIAGDGRAYIGAYLPVVSGPPSIFKSPIFH